MKKVVYIAGSFFLLLTALQIFCGNILDLIALIIYLPVMLLWDIPMLILPVSIILIIGFSTYAISTKEYQKNYNWHKFLFIVSMLAVLAFEMDSIMRTMNSFTTIDFVTFAICYFMLFLSMLFVLFVDSKKDSGYFIAANLLIVIYLVLKFICWVCNGF